MRLRKILRVATPIIIAFVLILSVSTAVLFVRPSFVSSESNETTYYLLTDHLGSVDVVLDEDGNVVERRDYLPYGSARAEVKEPSSPETNYGFTGKELDDETDLNYYGARYYDSEIGRFIQTDPLLLGIDQMSPREQNAFLGDPQNLNAYAYVHNNPIKFTDPTGLYKKDVHYDLTFFLASISGLEFEQSETVAYYNQYTDENPSTLPGKKNDGIAGATATYKNVRSGATKKYHFASRRDALAQVVGTLGTGNLSAFGEALHTFQDTYSHAGLNPFTHAILGDTPDITKNDPEKAMQMAKATFLLTRALNLSENGSGELTMAEYDAQTETIWKAAKPHVAEFVSAENQSNTLIGRTSMQLAPIEKKDE